MMRSRKTRHCEPLRFCRNRREPRKPNGSRRAKAGRGGHVGGSAPFGNLRSRAGEGNSTHRGVRGGSGHSDDLGNGWARRPARSRPDRRAPLRDSGQRILRNRPGKPWPCGSMFWHERGPNVFFGIGRSSARSSQQAAKSELGINSQYS